MREQLTWRDQLVAIADQGLRTVAGKPAARRASPAEPVAEAPLSAAEKRASAALMRVNRAGEISAQALYLGQSLFARSRTTRRQLLSAADEELDHLAWCTQRLAELGGRRSVLDPFWYSGAVVLGAAAGLAGDRHSLGFVAETERQVEMHLDDHLERLPKRDARSRAVLRQMSADEVHHGTTARLAGAAELPQPVRRLMSIGGSFLRHCAAVL